MSDGSREREQAGGCQGLREREGQLLSGPGVLFWGEGKALG
jgi:hypothetical protein